MSDWYLVYCKARQEDTAARNLERGDRVGIQAWAFADMEGIFEARSGQERVVVLLELPGQKVGIEVAIGELDL